MGEFSCNKCNMNFSMYFELRDHKAASHKEEMMEKMTLRFNKA